MRLHLLLFLTLFSALRLNAANLPKNEKDSLVAMIESLPTDSLGFEKMVDITKIIQASDDFLFFTELFLQKAIQSKAPRYVCKGCYFQIIYYSNNGCFDKLAPIFDRMAPIALEQQMYYEYFNARRILIESYIRQDLFERAIDEGLLMKQEALRLNNSDGIIAADMVVAGAYEVTARNTMAVELLNEALSMSRYDDYITRVQIIIRLLSATYNDKKVNMHLKGNLDLLRQTLAEMEAVSADNKTKYPFYYFYMHVIYAGYYLTANDLKLADFHRIEAEKYLPLIEFDGYKTYYHQMMTDYHVCRGDYKHALAENEKIFHLVRNHSESYYKHYIFQKARLLVHDGRAGEAIDIYKKNIPELVSVMRNLSEKQKSRLLANYNNDQNILKKELLKQWAHIGVLIFFSILLMILIFFTYKVIRFRHKLRNSTQELEEARILMEKANEEKTEFLHQVCHEIRTPLNAVCGFSDLLSENCFSEEERLKFCSIIESNSANLNQLINNILELSRIESGKMTLGEEERNPDVLLQDTIANMPGDIPVVLNLPEPDHDIRIRVDSAKLRNIIHSLYEERAGDAVCTLLIDRREWTARFVFEGSALAIEHGGFQKEHIRNEINRQYVSRQHGSYDIHTAHGTNIISIRYPLAE